MKTTKRSANNRGSRGNAPAGIQSLKRSFSMYITCILCNYWTSVMKHSARQKKKKNCLFFVCFVTGGNHEWWAAPPGAAHRSYNPGDSALLFLNGTLLNCDLTPFWLSTDDIFIGGGGGGGGGGQVMILIFLFLFVNCCTVTALSRLLLTCSCPLPS